MGFILRFIDKFRLKILLFHGNILLFRTRLLMRKTTTIYNQALQIEEAGWYHNQMSCKLQPKPSIQKSSITENSAEGRNEWTIEEQRKEFEAKISK